MSTTFRMDLRERWRSREVIVHRWLRQPGEIVPFREKVVEIAVDGQIRALNFTSRFGPAGNCGIYWHYSGEGEEVGPWGDLVEYNDLPVGAEISPHRPARTQFRRRPSYPKIFLSYRRRDSDAYAGRLHETLSSRFGAEAVFLDEFSILAGEPFAWTIQQAVWQRM